MFEQLTGHNVQQQKKINRNRTLQNNDDSSLRTLFPLSVLSSHLLSLLQLQQQQPLQVVPMVVLAVGPTGRFVP